MKKVERGAKNFPYPMPTMPILFTMVGRGCWRSGERFAEALSVGKDFEKRG